MSEGYETCRGLLRLYDDFAAEPDQDVPSFEYDGSQTRERRGGFDYRSRAPGMVGSKRGRMRAPREASDG